MTPHPLDRPVWNALSDRQSALSLGDDRARAFLPEVGPMAAARDDGADSQAALAALIPPGGERWLVEVDERAPPPGTIVASRAVCHQMVAERIAPGACSPHALPLGEADAAEMRALAALTRPGPFSTQTHRFGGFFGIRHEGRLVAMAGERMKPPGYSEVSGVCTHPDYRGQGHAAGLMRLVARQILARGETPFLHVYADNTGAISLYETLGFVFRRVVVKTVIVAA